MKLTRDDLKSLVREVIVEVLTEGLGETLLEARKPQVRQRRVLDEARSVQVTRSQSKVQKRFDPVLDRPVRDSIADITKDSIMQNIFADTARTTLTEQMNNDRPGPAQQLRSHSVEDRIVEAHDPEQIFGSEVTAKWENLAFMPTKSMMPPPPSNGILSRSELDRPAIKR